MRGIDEIRSRIVYYSSERKRPINLLKKFVIKTKWLTSFDIAHAKSLAYSECLGLADFSIFALSDLNRTPAISAVQPR